MTAACAGMTPGRGDDARLRRVPKQMPGNEGFEVAAAMVNATSGPATPHLHKRQVVVVPGHAPGAERLWIRSQGLGSLRGGEKFPWCRRRGWRGRVGRLLAPSEGAELVAVLE